MRSEEQPEYLGRCYLCGGHMYRMPDEHIRTKNSEPGCACRLRTEEMDFTREELKEQISRLKEENAELKKEIGWLEDGIRESEVERRR